MRYRVVLKTSADNTVAVLGDKLWKRHGNVCVNGTDGSVRRVPEENVAFIEEFDDGN